MTVQNPDQPVGKTTDDELEASRCSLEALFPGTLDTEVVDLIDEIVRHCDPPIRVVTESTWALKAGGLVHCAVCHHIRGERVELPRDRRGLCPEHAEWKIFYVHHSWSVAEQHQAALQQLREWLNRSLAPRAG